MKKATSQIGLVDMASQSEHIYWTCLSSEKRTMRRTVVFRPQTRLRSENASFWADCMKGASAVQHESNRIKQVAAAAGHSATTSNCFSYSPITSLQITAIVLQITAGRRAGEVAVATGTLRLARAVRRHAYKLHRLTARGSSAPSSTAARRFTCSAPATRWFAVCLTDITYDVRNRHSPALCCLGAKLQVIGSEI